MNDQIPARSPPARWSAFFIGALLEYLAALGAGLLIIGFAISGFETAVDLEHCAAYNGPDAQTLIQYCAQNELILFMSEPHHLAKLFVVPLIITCVFGYYFCAWGIKKHNRMMWFSGLVAALFLYGAGPQFRVAALGLLLGHSLGYLIALRHAAKVPR